MHASKRCVKTIGCVNSAIVMTRPTIVLRLFRWHRRLQLLLWRKRSWHHLRSNFVPSRQLVYIFSWCQGGATVATKRRRHKFQTRVISCTWSSQNRVCFNFLVPDKVLKKRLQFCFSSFAVRCALFCSWQSRSLQTTTPDRFLPAKRCL